MLRILDHSYKILIIGVSGSGKTKAFFNLTKQQVDDDYGVIDKICLYVKFPNEAKYWYLIKKRENNGLKNLKDPKPLTEFSSNIPDVVKNIEEYNPCRKRKILIVFDDMAADMISK